MEVQMIKLIPVVVVTAIPAFAAGVWTQPTLIGSHPTETITPSTISPLEMQSKVKPDDLPVQYMRGDFN
jgi:hypothetical protein